MSSKPVEPQLGANSFSCPHCGAHARQYFLRPFAKDYDKGKGPSPLGYNDDWYQALKSNVEKATNKDERRRLQEQQQFLERLKKHTLTYCQSEHSEQCRMEMVNVAFSMCFACDGFAIWVADKLIYPVRSRTITAHEEMPGDIREDFDEAASIVDKSPRGAAALLRLCIQKLMPVLGEKGKDLNEDIASLVRKGLEAQIQQALDIVRVTGNHAVHPGQIDLEDNKATAIALFELVNLIVERCIATPQRIEAMF